MLTEAAYHQELDARGREFLEGVGRQTRSLWGTHALMGLGVDPEVVGEIVQTRLGQVPDGPFGRVAAGTFDTFYAMFLACRWGNELPGAAMAHIKRVMTEGVLERGNTENHWLMYYVGNLLAAERWPEVDVWWNGLPRRAMHAEATRWLLGTIDRTARLGHHEYDSTQYHGWHLLPMIALADHAGDPHMREQAARMATLLVADMALEYFHGAWAGGHAREISRRNTWTLEGTASALGFYYFGDVSFDPIHAREDAMCPAVNARYRPPAMLAEMARDRSRAYAVKQTKAPRTIYRHVDREAQPVRKYTWMSRSFALGSTQAGLPGAPAGPIDLVSWDLTWSGPKHRAKVVCNHPYLHPGRFSAFLSELPQVIGRSVPSAKPFLQNPDRLFGGSPYEQMMQHEGALLVLYRVPADDPAPYVNLYLPRGIGWIERGGWILGNAGPFYVGVRPIGTCRWLSIREDTHIDGWLVRIDGPDMGVALEAVEADEAGPFERFCEEMDRNRLDLSGWPGEGRVRFEARSGHTLDMVYDGVHRIDGDLVDYEAWPLFEAPGVEAALGTGKMTFRYGGREVCLDFEVDPRGELIPMRVIG